MTRRPIRITARLAAAATLLSSAFFLPTGAFAGCTGSIMDPKFPQIEVVGNGSEYVEVEGTGFTWTARINVECGTLGRVKAWEMAPLIEVNGVGILDFRLYGASESYPTFSRPKSVHRTESGCQKKSKRKDVRRKGGRNLFQVK